MPVELHKVAAVVVTYNRKETLRQCLDCLLGQNGAACDIVLIDNDSSDGTAEMIAADYSLPRIKYFNTGCNIGGAGGFMCGIEAAVRLGYDYIWIMDDDCLPSDTALAALLDVDEKLAGDWGFLCSAIYWTDGEICQFNRPKKDVFRHVTKKDYEEELVSVKMASFVSVMFRADVIREVGLPLGEYFIWTDDYEYTGRISNRLRSFFVPSSKVTHAMKENSRPSLATVSSERIGRFYYLSRNDVHCYRQHGLMGHAYLVAKTAYTVSDVMLHAKHGRCERLTSLIQGIKDGVYFEPQIDGLSQNDSRQRQGFPKNNLGFDIIVNSISNLKNVQILRIVTVPFMQASFVVRDCRYRHSTDSRMIESLKDSHCGERCFIVGNGPSLTVDDLNSLKGNFSFAANRIYCMFDQTDWRPDIHIIVDREVIANDLERLLHLGINNLYVNKTLFAKMLNKKAKVTFLNSHAHHYTIKRFSNHKVAFSSRPDLVVYDGFTVTYVAIQLALFMGFSEIILIGMDHTFTYTVDPDGTVHKKNGINDHCFSDPAGAVVNPQPKEGVELAYKMARNEAEERNVRILNATRGGALEIFERVNLDDILKENVHGE